MDVVSEGVNLGDQDSSGRGGKGDIQTSLSQPPPAPKWRRIWDEGEQSHYFKDEEEGRVVWDLPKGEEYWEDDGGGT